MKLVEVIHAAQVSVVIDSVSVKVRRPDVRLHYFCVVTCRTDGWLLDFYLDKKEKKSPLVCPAA